MDKNTFLYTLHFNAPLHISNERADYASGSSYMSSDALYAAIFFSFQKLGLADAIPEDSQPFGFTISSLFPFQTISGVPMLFFPRPRFQDHPSPHYEPDTTVRKKIKKATWVSQLLFENILEGKALENYHEAGHFAGGFWSEAKLNSSPVESITVPRVTVSRSGETDTRIFYIERFYFRKDAGLFFLAQFETENHRENFESALRLLGDEGLGTDRNIGNGKFSFHARKGFEFNLSPSRGLSVNLGLYCPTDQQELDALIAPEQAGFDLVRRGGWMSEPYNTWRKRSVFMFREGCCFAGEGTKNIFVKGAMVDLKPLNVPVPHPVWRCGRTFFLSF